MNFKLFFLSIFVLVAILSIRLVLGQENAGRSSTQPVIASVTGTLKFHQLTSKVFGNTRTIRVLLPPGYFDPSNRNRRYPVLYLNDGQNLFDISTSMFNRMEWQVDETLDRLVREGKIEPLIVVGVDNAGRQSRFNEYFPYEDKYLRPPIPSPQGKQYPDFLANEVLPLVNANYRTQIGREHTGIGGSSAGAVAALQAVIAKPDDFGLLLMESPSLYISEGQLIRDTASLTRLPIKAYLGVGTNEGGRPECKPGDLDREAVRDVIKLKQVLQDAGMNDRSLKVVIEDCTVHNEEAWARRFPLAMEFFYGKDQPGANNMFPQWSHDGKRIAFTSDRDGDPEIYVMNADGSDQRRLTNSKGRDAHPYFSRDGKRILFQSPRENGLDTNIYVMNSDGSNVVQLTKLKGFAGVPVYSQDEKKIAFMWRKSNDFDDGTKWLIAVMDADGSNLLVVTDGKANDQVPNWSRDGKRLLFFSDRTGKDQIYVMSADGTDTRRVHTGRANDNAAFWSPDNKKITFVSDRDGNSDLFVMNNDGSNLRRLTDSKATERGGVWSPDGGRIVFAADGDGPSSIFIISANGTGMRRLTN